MATLIGLELRIGYPSAGGMREVAVFPVSIDVPQGYDYFAVPEAEITFHCLEGDVTTTRTRLPMGRGDSISVHQADDKLREQIRAGRARA